MRYEGSFLHGFYKIFRVMAASGFLKYCPRVAAFSIKAMRYLHIIGVLLGFLQSVDSTLAYFFFHIFKRVYHFFAMFNKRLFWRSQSKRYILELRPMV